MSDTARVAVAVAVAIARFAVDAAEAAAAEEAGE